MSPGDLYVYAHGNGAVFSYFQAWKGDDIATITPLDEVLKAIAEIPVHGGQVFLGQDDAPLARDTVDRLRAAGVPLVDFVPARPPNEWHQGTTALMEAAAAGNEEVVRDLIARGAPVEQRDVSGATALHHAASKGRTAMVGLLIDGGAQPTSVTKPGLTPYDVAVASGHDDTAAHLRHHGSESAAQDVERFRWQFGGMHIYLLSPVVAVGMLALIRPLTGGILFAVAFLAFLGAVNWPPGAFWAGGTPRELTGTTLVVRRWSLRKQPIDLTRVTWAGLGGGPSRNRGRYLVLAHPDGRTLSARGKRRLMLPEEDLPSLSDPEMRFLVVPLGGGTVNRVVLPVGNLLSARKVPLSASMTRQLNQARHAQWST